MYCTVRVQYSTERIRLLFMAYVLFWVPEDKGKPCTFYIVGQRGKQFRHGCTSPTSSLLGLSVVYSTVCCMIFLSVKKCSLFKATMFAFRISN